MGFGGTIIGYILASFVVDIKDLIAVQLYVASFASILIVISDFKSFDKKNFLFMMIYSIPTALLGAFLLEYLHSYILLKILALLLLFIVLMSFIKNHIPKFLEKYFLLLSGLIQGIFGTGGPFAVMAMHDRFKKKENLRVTLAMFFIFLNAFRTAQYLYQGTFTLTQITVYWWIPLPLFFAVWLGHKIHKYISEKTFKNILYILLTISAISLLLK